MGKIYSESSVQVFSQCRWLISPGCLARVLLFMKGTFPGIHLARLLSHHTLHLSIDFLDQMLEVTSWTGGMLETSGYFKNEVGTSYSGRHNEAARGPNDLSGDPG